MLKGLGFIRFRGYDVGMQDFWVTVFGVSGVVLAAAQVFAADSI